MSWWLDDPRYGKSGWTLISLPDGTAYFVRSEPRKRRRAPRPIRFAGLEVGAILIQREKVRGYIEHRDPTPIPVVNSNERHDPIRSTAHAIVTDLWLDPVLGQEDQTRGRMVGLRYLREGTEVGSKWSTTLRGLASQQWHYATEAEIADLTARGRRVEAIRSGNALALRKPPKRPDPERIRPL